jgi:hypothetical protein
LNHSITFIGYSILELWDDIDLKTAITTNIVTNNGANSDNRIYAVSRILTQFVLTIDV